MELLSIEDCYKVLIVTDYWKQPSTDVCRKVVKFLNEYIIGNPKDARAYYLRSMAKFHLMDLVPPDYFWHKDSEYAKGKTYNPDEAYDDYNIAISIDPDIVSKNPDIRLIITSCHTFQKYYFRKPMKCEIFTKLINPSLLDRMSAEKLHREYCEEVVPATYDEWHG